MNSIQCHTTEIREHSHDEFLQKKKKENFVDSDPLEANNMSINSRSYSYLIHSHFFAKLIFN